VSKEEAKQQAKKLARSLGLKVYGIVDKTGTSEEPALGLCRASASRFEPPKQGTRPFPSLAEKGRTVRRDTSAGV
jgi:hypothetical protein